MKVAVLGATGFTGEMLVDILTGHPEITVSYLSSRTPKPRRYQDIFPRFAGKISVKCEHTDVSRALSAADFFFLALPHTVSMQIAPLLLDKGKRVVDLSADYRLRSAVTYKKYYKKTHSDRKHLSGAVYGMPEVYASLIKDARLVANPGCYPTAAILGLAPLCKAGMIGGSDIYIDAYSSITGAGRKASLDFHYAAVNGNIWAYKPFIHQHVPEIEQVLSAVSGKKVSIQFVPHVAGIESGIYATIYVPLKRRMTVASVTNIYKKFYGKAPFVRIRKGLPRLKDVTGTNFCDIGFALNKGSSCCVVSSAIDNLIKGAAGCAVQNMNIMCGFKENTGLI